MTINLVMTYNGSGYKPHLFLTAYQGLCAKPIKTRLYTPRTNSKAKRFI
jgi:transposase InsO family protein